MSMLKVENLSVHYGMIQAVRDVSFEVNEGEVVSLIGANGAGKTTILRTLSGLVRPSAGKIEFLGKEIQKLPAQKIVAGGLSQVPEGRHVFPGLTVMENLEMGAFLKKNREENQANLKKVFSRFPRLEERKTKMRQLFQVVNSRCWLWDALSCLHLSSFSWMSRQWDLPRSLSKKFLISFKIFRSKEQRFS